MQFEAGFLEMVERTPLARSYRFERPEEFDFKAGQWIKVTLGEADGLMHPLSLSDCPGEKGFMEFTKRLTGSPFCGRLDGLQSGDKVAFDGPMGHYCLDDVKGPVVFLTGGIGITPIRSILRMMSHAKDPRETVLIYGNKDEDDIAFLDELGELELPNFRMVHVLVEPQGKLPARKGFITADIIKEEVADLPGNTYMVSGPPVMVNAMAKNLESLGLPESRMMVDKFMGYD